MFCRALWLLLNALWSVFRVLYCLSSSVYLMVSPAMIGTSTIMSRMIAAVLASILRLDRCVDSGLDSVPIGRIGGSDKKRFVSFDQVFFEVALMILCDQLAWVGLEFCRLFLCEL